MSTIDELMEGRLKKIKAIKNLGFLAYPSSVKRTHTCKEAQDKFEEILKSEKEIVLVGRIFSLRQHGGLIFCDIVDGTGKMQILFKKDRIGPKNFDFFMDNFDIGDFIESRGIVFKTQKGEKTVEVADYKIISKSLRPLPEKWHGLQDIEERYRKRYLDLMFNPEVKNKFEIRTKIIAKIREFLSKREFLEVETPVLQPLYGGASARPFKTHLNAMDMDLYLRIAPELYLKRLLVGGFEKVFEIGKCFRNEGMDKSHNPDFTMLEFYWAFADYKDLMKLSEEMITFLLKEVLGETKIKYGEKEIDFKTPWPRIEYNEIFKKHVGIDLEEINEEGLKKEAKKLGINAKGGKAEIADEIYKKLCRPKIVDPVFITNYPVEAFPLAKQLDNNPKKSASFQLVAGGLEVIKAFSELNDPVEQSKRFDEQEIVKKEGFDEAQVKDKDFLEALEYGMPPAAGLGMGIDRLTVLLTNSNSIREVILFPAMRPED